MVFTYKDFRKQFSELNKSEAIRLEQQGGEIKRFRQKASVAAKREAAAMEAGAGGSFLPTRLGAAETCVHPGVSL